MITRGKKKTSKVGLMVNTNPSPSEADTFRANYCQTSIISRIIVDNKFVDHSDSVEASPVGATPTTCSFSTQHLSSMDWTKTTARRDEEHFSFGIWCNFY